MIPSASTRVHAAKLGCAAAVLGVLIASAGRADACSCLPQMNLRPADGEAEVPANTRIWVSSTMLTWNGAEDEADFASVLELRDPDGLPVPLVGASVGGTTMLTPEERLEPGSYQLVWKVAEGTSGPLPPSQTFEVVEALDEVAPVPLEVTSVEARWQVAEQTCGTIYSLTFALSEAAPVLVADLHSSVSEEEVATLTGGPLVSVKGVDSDEFMLTGMCGDGSAPEGTELNARFGAFDLAGNFSGWGDSFETTVPDGPVEGGEAEPADQSDEVPNEEGDLDGDSDRAPGAAGCSVAPAAGGPSIGALLLSLVGSLALFRRRRAVGES